MGCVNGALLCVGDLVLSGRIQRILTLAVALFALAMAGFFVRAYGSMSPPVNPVRLIFIHHSTGQNWLSDSNGGLGIALRDNTYFVSDTNYGWGPDSIGSSTDIGHWWLWFRGPNSATYLSALYAEGERHSDYSRLLGDVAGENQIVMFKSCFPNSGLRGSVSDPVPLIDSNPLREESCGSQYHTVANAKGIYMDLLEYFKTQPNKLFVVITAPPLQDSTYADNARAFNNWLVNDWLDGYTMGNVFVFDFYNVLTSNGGDPNTNDLGLESGNHHRWWNGAVQHNTDGDDDASPNTLEYPSGDDHPSKAGNQKATAEFIPLLNNAYNNFVANPGPTPTPTTTTPTPAATPTPTPTAKPTPSPTFVPTSPTPSPSPETTATGAGLPPETFYVAAILGAAVILLVIKRPRK